MKKAEGFRMPDPAYRPKESIAVWALVSAATFGLIIFIIGH